MLIESAVDQPAPSAATGDRSRLLWPVPSFAEFLFFARSYLQGFAFLPTFDIGSPVTFVHTGKKKSTYCAPQHRKIIPTWASLRGGETGAAPRRRVPVRET
jgi:hypothetical protein